MIEGDGILPGIVEHPDLQSHVASRALRVVFLTPASEDRHLANMIARGRGVTDRAQPGLRRMAAMNWLYTQWLTREAEARSIPVVMTQPWETLADRIVAAN